MLYRASFPDTGLCFVDLEVLYGYRVGRYSSNISLDMFRYDKCCLVPQVLSDIHDTRTLFSCFLLAASPSLVAASNSRYIRLHLWYAFFGTPAFAYMSHYYNNNTWEIPH